MTKQIATFAAGCFWGVEAKLRSIPGVTETTVGYTGGVIENPTYQMVCTNRTGHAEAVQVIFDSQDVTYENLVRAFFEMHNPTTKNRQGFDIGNQYRSAIFYHNPEQREISETIKNELNQKGKFRKPIITEIFPAGDFYKAEEYHQHYYEKHRFGHF
jgi:peptide-methionine (S)-S-oxide reductase